MYDARGTRMRKEKTIGQYFEDDGGQNAILLEFYGVIQLRICYNHQFFVTMNEKIRKLDDLRKRIPFEKI